MNLVKSTERQLSQIRNGEPMTPGSQVALAARLSLPSMLAQLSTIVMEYIDAAMVGSLGAAASASIGLVSTTIWLFGGVCHSAATGFYVQVAHKLGANDNESARSILRQSIVATLISSIVLMAIGCAISHQLPMWLGGQEEINGDATTYFMIFSLTLPALQMNSLAGGMLRSSGNMHIPSLINIAMCALDVVFNFVLIFPTRDVTIMGREWSIYGMGLGVTGAAIGTALSMTTCAAAMTWYLTRHSKELKIKGHDGSYKPKREVIERSLKIGLPMGIEHAIFCGAQIVTTKIVAPLGTAAIAANSFGITVESLCYMPGYGISESATTLVGQSLGAKRKELARSFAKITVGLGVGIMTIMGIVMYMAAPAVMSIMTPDVLVQQMSVEALRIEAFAEPMFAASIVAYGVFVGAGDTLVPCIMNLLSIWLIRISLAAWLSTEHGLNGVWIAMCTELCCRGAMFLARLKSDKWTESKSSQDVFP